MRLLAFLVLLLSFAAVARADILLLEGGGRVEGVVREGPDKLTITNVHGSVEIAKGRVLRRIKARYVTEIYEDVRAQSDAADAEANFRLALWCERQGLPKRARSHLEATISLDADHAKARAKLGFVMFSGAWLTRAEAKEAALVAAGFIKFGKRWFTKEGLDAYLRALAETSILKEEVLKKRAEREAAELAALTQAERLKKAEIERRAAEAALARAEEERLERERLRAENEELRDLLRRLAYRGGGWGLGWSSWPPLRPVPYYPDGVGLPYYGRADPRVRVR